MDASVLQKPNPMISIPGRQPATIVIARRQCQFANTDISKTPQAAAALKVSEIKRMHIECDLHDRSVETRYAGATINPCHVRIQLS